MVFFLASTRESWLLSGQRDSLSSSPPPPTPTTPTPSTTARISPAVLFIIIILAVIFFISGLLHLLVRFLVRKPAASGGSSPQPAGASAAGPDALQRQLQQLFHLHDSGLDQAFIDALPVFLYREMVGPKEPFDCAVCLSEFARDDRLRLLPACGHAFHIACIDTWLLSNSTCPLCRAALFAPGLAIENPVFDLDDRGDPTDCEDGLPPLPACKPADEITEEKRLFPVRLGKFRRLSNVDDEGDHGNAVIGGAKGEKGETSSSKLDARRCYSMGSYQYVVGDAELRVPLSHGSMRFGDCKGGGRGRGLNGDLRANGLEEGRRIGATSRGESFSVSKIWLWSNKKGKFPVSSDASSLDGGLPWLRKSAADV